MIIPQAFKLKGDFGTVYITDSGMTETCPEGVLYVSNIHVDDNTIDRDSLKYDVVLRHLYDILDHMYILKGNLNDIDITVKRLNNYYFDFNCYITLYHGDIEISNSLGQRSLLKNVYTRTKLVIDEKGVKFRTLEIFRTKLNVIEFNNKFLHSHSARGNRINFSYMCLGDSELNKYFFYRKKRYFDMSMYHMFLEAYLSWESKEGGPYYTIESVYDTKIKENNIDIDIDCIDKLIYNNADKFQIIILNDKFTVSSDFIHDINVENLNKVNNFNCIFDPEWFINNNKVFTQNRSIETSYFFKGKKLVIEIEDFDLNEHMQYINTFYNKLSNDVLSIVKNRISSIINLNYENNEETVRDTGIETEG